MEAKWEMTDEQEKKAGYPPAVKAGGMRIGHDKTHPMERPPKDAEDCTRLTPPVNITPNAMSITGAAARGMKGLLCACISNG
ncbi:unnamed protein product [Hermetia illucens]|uniref:Uncharacterized protein n=1 Tax=Hermetia illucens TaxID=343691 RepID=A0A7R8V1M4_HERIL|nr:unnamed protein product [Hermetia illucens]